MAPSPFFTPNRMGRGGPFFGIVTSTHNDSPNERSDGSAICSGIKKATGWSSNASFSPRRSTSCTCNSEGSYPGCCGIASATSLSPSILRMTAVTASNGKIGIVGRRESPDTGTRRPIVEQFSAERSHQADVNRGDDEPFD